MNISLYEIQHMRFIKFKWHNFNVENLLRNDSSSSSNNNSDRDNIDVVVVDDDDNIDNDTTMTFYIWISVYSNE